MAISRSCFSGRLVKRLHLRSHLQSWDICLKVLSNLLSWQINGMLNFFFICSYLNILLKSLLFFIHRGITLIFFTEYALYSKLFLDTLYILLISLSVCTFNLLVISLYYFTYKWVVTFLVTFFFISFLELFLAKFVSC